MKNLGSVVVLNHWKREKEGKAQLKLTARGCKPLGITPNLSYDDGSLGVLNNFCKALTLPIEGASGWRLVLHDDLVVATGSLEKLNYIMNYMPENEIISAYCPSNNGYDVAFENKNHILRTSTNIWGQALAFPESLIPEFIDFVNTKVKSGYKWEDRVVAVFLRERKEKCNCIVPSLFQHLGSYRSTLGFAGKIGGRYRYSEHFDPNFKPEDIDWEYEMENHAKNETALHAKEVLL